MTVVDYPKPVAGAAVVAAHVGGVLRYLPKEHGSTVVVGITATELADLDGHNIAVGLVYEDSSASWMSGGYVAGVQAGQWIQRQCAALGVSPQCVYLAADSNTLTGAAVNACLDGAASILGRDVVGLYGYLPQLQAARAGGHASWYWLTGRYVTPDSYPWINLYQCQGSQPAGIPTVVTVGGQTADNDLALQPAWGQLGADPVAQINQNDWDALIWRVGALTSGLTAVAGGPTKGEAVGLVSKLNAQGLQLTSVQGALAKEETDLLAAVKAVTAGSVDPKAVASALESSGLPNQIVTALLALLAKATVTTS